MNDTPAPDAGSPFEASSTALDSGRYSSLLLDNGDYVIFDREGTETWLQSDLVVDVSA
ncbi:hypothetical protein HWV23_05920 [Natronomonas halophila]|jgi:hypothetical protein|uniref:hypothetical protein n=1 Tax=Natronomonas halophila TaxID=2747817 RepID=UPI0015B5F379|nr:hypothetical protein [Natronomonas halophila]QLD85282.1 hypothetical protein HWV23_05920 [Natronomonas halophila]